MQILRVWCIQVAFLSPAGRKATDGLGRFCIFVKGNNGVASLSPAGRGSGAGPRRPQPDRQICTYYVARNYSKEPTPSLSPAGRESGARRRRRLTGPRSWGRRQRTWMTSWPGSARAERESLSCRVAALRGAI